MNTVGKSTAGDRCMYTHVCVQVFVGVGVGGCSCGWVWVHKQVHMYVCIGQTDREQICSRINNN